MALSPSQREANKRVQRLCNAFTKKYLRGIMPLRVDGAIGAATKSRIKWIKFYLGYGKNREANSAKVTAKFIRALKDPKGTWQSKAIRDTGANRRRRQRRDASANRTQAVYTRGVTTYDGRPVAKVAVPYLRYARANGWRGGLNSGWRSPQYTQSLCYRICGRPACPGRCGGTASNHVGQTPDRFAVDVGDYHTFARLMRQMPLRQGQRRIFNALGAQDPVHFSPSGR